MITETMHATHPAVQAAYIWIRERREDYGGAFSVDTIVKADGTRQYWMIEERLGAKFPVFKFEASWTCIDRFRRAYDNFLNSDQYEVARYIFRSHVSIEMI